MSCNGGPMAKKSKKSPYERELFDLEETFKDPDIGLDIYHPLKGHGKVTDKSYFSLPSGSFFIYVVLFDNGLKQNFSDIDSYLLDL